jgi:hypothetical protein
MRAVLQQQLRCAEMKVILLLVALAFDTIGAQDTSARVERRSAQPRKAHQNTSRPMETDQRPQALAADRLHCYIDLQQPLQE